MFNTFFSSIEEPNSIEPSFQRDKQRARIRRFVVLASILLISWPLLFVGMTFGHLTGSYQAVFAVLQMCCVLIAAFLLYFVWLMHQSLPALEQLEQRRQSAARGNPLLLAE